MEVGPKVAEEFLLLTELHRKVGLQAAAEVVGPQAEVQEDLVAGQNLLAQDGHLEAQEYLLLTELHRRVGLQAVGVEVGHQAEVQ